MHVDFPYYQTIRVHSCLYTNPDVVWKVEDEQFQIPADGNFYWFDTGKYHSVVNNGNETRIVLSINLLVYFNREKKQIYDHNQDLFDLMDKGQI